MINPSRVGKTMRDMFDFYRKEADHGFESRVVDRFVRSMKLSGRGVRITYAPKTALEFQEECGLSFLLAVVNIDISPLYFFGTSVNANKEAEFEANLDTVKENSERKAVMVFKCGRELMTVCIGFDLTNCRWKVNGGESVNDVQIITLKRFLELAAEGKWL